MLLGMVEDLAKWRFGEKPTSQWGLHSRCQNFGALVEFSGAMDFYFLGV